MLKVGKAGCGLLLGLFVLMVAVGLVGTMVKAIDAGTTHAGDRGTSASAPTLGEVLRVPANQSHPALQVRADKVVRVASTAPPSPLRQGEHLAAVRYSIRNDGTQLWGATSPYLQFAALTSDGQYAQRGLDSSMPASKLMPAAFNLQPGQTRRGYVVFALAKGAKLVRVSVKTGFGSSDAVEWLIP